MKITNKFTPKNFLGYGMITFLGSSILMADSIDGLKETHISDVDPSVTSFTEDVRAAKAIGEVTALIAEASVADEASEKVDGQSGDTAFPYMTAKAIATVGEYDADTGYTLTGYPDGNAAWLADEDTLRFAYQSESYSTMSSETYPWEMANGVSFTGSHIHTIDYDRAKFADFLNNGDAASTMVEASGKLFDTVYNVFGDVVVPKASGGLWGNQSLPDKTLVEYGADFQLSDADFFFQSFCGAHYEPANKYGAGIGFVDDVWINGEEWNIQTMFTGTTVNTHDTMGLASIVVDVANEVAYTVPALGQSGYEKLLPVNPGHSDYVVLVCAGYNHQVEPCPIRIYVGKKGVDAAGNPVDQAGAASDRDKFLARNGLLYGKIYGLAVANADYANLNIDTIDTEAKMMEAYLQDETAPNNFTAKFFSTSYQWSGWSNPVSVRGTEVFLWDQAGEQPTGYTFFTGDSKTEHPAGDPDITKFRYVQNLTQTGGILGVEFTDLINELTSAGGMLPASLSVDCTRIVGAYDGALSLEVKDKGIKPNGETHATDRAGSAKTTANDGLQWIKTSDADVLIVDEDSGNSQGERKFALVLNPETLELADPAKGYFLASAGGSANLRALFSAAAYPGTFSRATSAEFSGSWNVTAMVTKKADGSFYSMSELTGTQEQTINQSIKLADSTLVGVVQQKGESGGSVAAFRDDQGGQAFVFKMDFPTFGGMVTFDLGSQGSQSDSTALVQNVRAGDTVTPPTVVSNAGWFFTGWDQDYDNITGDTVIRAQYAQLSEMNGLGFYTESQLASMAGNPIIEQNASGNFVITLDLQKSDDLSIWEDMNLNPETLRKNADGDIEIEFTKDGDAAFYQFVGSN